MQANDYRSSAAWALALHAVAALLIGGWMFRSLPVDRPLPPALTAVTLELADSPVEPEAAEPAPQPREVAQPPRFRPVERDVAHAHAAPRPPAEPAAAAHVDNLPARSEPRLMAFDIAKTGFLAAIESHPDGPAVAPAFDGRAAARGQPDVRPGPRTAIQPLYPIGARRRGEAGQVMLDARVAADGRVEQVNILSTSGFAELDRAAQRSVEEARFTPARRQGVPVAARVTLTILFRLTE